MTGHEESVLFSNMFIAAGAGASWVPVVGNGETGAWAMAVLMGCSNVVSSAIASGMALVREPVVELVYHHHGFLHVHWCSV